MRIRMVAKMTNAELIKGLRWCADESICCDDFSGEKCPCFDEKKDSCSVNEMLHAAADALEATEKRIAELEAQLPKEGEWIDMGDFEMCSVCKIAQRKKYRQYNGGFTWVRTDFCPKCGTRMMKGEQE